jgi:hypothetical protein
MTLTLLFDLDDTLLNTNLEAFVPAYFQALSKHLASRVAPEVMLPALMSGTRLMNESQDPTHTLKEIFEADFYTKIGISREELAGTLENFYDHIFPTLGKLTTPRQEAVPILQPIHYCRRKRHMSACAGLDLTPKHLN